MVAVIISGKSIKGALSYNEEKVREGKAELLAAVQFPSDRLSLDAKLARFRMLTKQNRRVRTNAVHIFLSFDPSEKIEKDKLFAIAREYMRGIGFERQPFLLYRHDDTANSHLHIVTTNIEDGGKRIPLHNIGRDKSEPVRKEIEKIFGLVPAEGREQQQGYQLPDVLEEMIYGKAPTKAAISKIVRSVIRDYRFTSLAEFNAVLQGQNVVAVPGEEGTRMFERKGLVYSALKDGNRVGVPIKASSIYTEPTLPVLEKKFKENAEARMAFRDDLRKAIDAAIETGVTDKGSFKAALAAGNITVVYRENEKMVYGISYIDHNNLTVFNGSALGKAYSAAGILRRISNTEAQEQQARQWNKEVTAQALKEADYKQGIAAVVAELYGKGLRLQAASDSESSLRYNIGHQQTAPHCYTPVTDKMAAYFQVNDMTEYVCQSLNREAESQWQSNYLGNTEAIIAHLQQYLKNLIAAQPEAALPAQRQDSRKKKRRKPNW